MGQKTVVIINLCLKCTYYKVQIALLLIVLLSVLAIRPAYLARIKMTFVAHFKRVNMYKTVQDRK